MSAAAQLAAAKAAAAAKQESKCIPLPIWEPWRQYAVKPEILPIEGPPCARCYFWMPVVRMHPEYKHSIGVTLCHNSEMKPDFSCFDGSQREW